LVSVERSAEEDARQLFDAINDKLIAMGHQPFTNRDQVEAVIYIVVRKELNGGMLIGRTAKSKAMAAVLEFLTDIGTITEEFCKAIYATWLMERDARQK
jgi:hypothetical protein